MYSKYKKYNENTMDTTNSQRPQRNIKKPTRFDDDSEVPVKIRRKSDSAKTATNNPAKEPTALDKMAEIASNRLKCQKYYKHMSHEQKNTRNERSRERRQELSPEQLKELRRKEQERKQVARAAMTPQEREDKRASERARRANMTDTKSDATSNSKEILSEGMRR